MEREFIFKDGKFFEVKVKEKEEMDMEEILEEMEWVSEMLDKIVDKRVNGERKQ